MALIRLFVFGFLVLSVIYVLTFFWLRSLRRERLENDWDQGRALPLDGEGREGYIARGMAGLGRSLAVRLLWLIYVLPLIAMGAIIYLVNYA
ncbi:hypothetical protein ACEYYB_03620 [Paracoccus sp. p4-l81]|uniref:hypothetical protein n=1 Tax=unclassified Paracoccus (in: a-proteobacteria) TaxID=2688777 RepID=UPI0035BB7E0D